jgi:hypothetical protein
MGFEEFLEPFNVSVAVVTPAVSGSVRSIKEFELGN